MAYRVAIGGFLHETNTFAPVPAGLDAYRQGGGHIPMCEGDALLSSARGVNLGISGAIAQGHRDGWQIIPTTWAGAVPSAHTTKKAFETIAGNILAGIRDAGRLDGVFLDMHGAMVCEHLDDGEGELAARVRSLVGPEVPIAVSLDLHGNISHRLVDLVDVIVGFRTYPHVDMARTGERAAALLTRMMRSGWRPAKAARQLDYLVPIPWQCTDLEPGRSLYALLDTLESEEGEGGVVSASLFMGFPAADIPDCGPLAVTYADDTATAEAGLARVLTAFARAEPRFAGTTYSASEGVALAQRLKAGGLAGPVVLADTQDNPGAGGISATTGMLAALIEAEAQNAAIGLIVDAAAARRAHEAGQGAVIDLSLGGHPDLPDAPPLALRAEVEALSDGRLVAAGPFYGGTRLDLGPSACLRIGGVRVALCSRTAQMADREMFRFVGISPEEADILVVKSSTHFRADFAPVAGEILICLAPGPMPMNPADLPFRRLRRGLRLSPMGPAFGQDRPHSRTDAQPAFRGGGSNDTNGDTRNQPTV